MLDKIRWCALHSEHAEVFVDLTQLEEITDSAAVLLTAELERCCAYMLDKKMYGTAPSKAVAAFNVLAGLGTFEFLGASELDASDEGKHWFQIFASRETEGERAYELLQHFLPFLKEHVVVDAEWQRRFYRALVDAMTNALEHAYFDRSRMPWLVRRWWAAGLVNRSDGTVRFVFWDQGLGIPRTMVAERRRRMLQSLFMSDGAWIKKATEEGASRHRSSRRGHGLWALIELIDVAPGGTLDIFSGKGRFRYQKDVTPDVESHRDDIGGTLVVWTLRKENSP